MMAARGRVAVRRFMGGLSQWEIHMEELMEPTIEQLPEGQEVKGIPYHKLQDRTSDRVQEPPLADWEYQERVYYESLHAAEDRYCNGVLIVRR